MFPFPASTCAAPFIYCCPPRRRTRIVVGAVAYTGAVLARHGSAEQRRHLCGLVAVSCAAPPRNGTRALTDGRAGRPGGAQISVTSANQPTIAPVPTGTAPPHPCASPTDPQLPIGRAAGPVTGLDTWLFARRRIMPPAADGSCQPLPPTNASWLAPRKRSPTFLGVRSGHGRPHTTNPSPSTTSAHPGATEQEQHHEHPEHHRPTRPGSGTALHHR